MYKVAIKAYFLEEKRHYYNKANDLDYIKVKQEHLSEVIESLMLKKEYEYALLVPLVTLVPKMLDELVKEVKGYLITIITRVIKTVKLRNNEVDELTRKLQDLKINAMTCDNLQVTVNALKSDLKSTITS
jgi:hypothetical protein